jgi:signal transduction histidine kinase
MATRDELAEMVARLKGVANHSGRALHDHAGPLLSVAGMHLQLLRTDHPEISEIDTIAKSLEQAFEHVRAVSQELAPSPVLRAGFKAALEGLAERVAAEHPGIAAKVSYTARAKVPTATACAVYDAAESAVTAAAGARGTSRIAISAGGARTVSVRVADNGNARGRAKALEAARRVAQAQGLLVTIATEKSTIVSIRYALRRPARG